MALLNVQSRLTSGESGPGHTRPDLLVWIWHNDSQIHPAWLSSLDCQSFYGQSLEAASPQVM